MSRIEFQIARAVVARAHGPTGGLVFAIAFPSFSAGFHNKPCGATMRFHQWTASPISSPTTRPKALRSKTAKDEPGGHLRNGNRPRHDTVISLGLARGLLRSEERRF